jgi:plasmid maintenance system antidote protein VapI
MLTTEHNAVLKFGPGYFIREQMEIRNWSPEKMAKIMNVTIDDFYRILNNECILTEETAHLLGSIFNTSAQYWTNLDTGYRSWLVQ